MKKKYSILMMLFLSVGTLTATQLKQKITPSDLGYTEPAHIFSYEIDENTLALTVGYMRNEQSFNDFWLYDLNKEEAIHIIYEDSLLSTLEIFWDYHSNYSYNGFGNFLRDGDLVYTIGRYSLSDGKLENGFHLISTNLVTKHQNIQYLAPLCNTRIGFLRADEGNFIVESGGCEAPFKLMAFNDSSWTEVWKIEDFGWVNLYYNDVKSPFYHKGKIYLSAQNQQYVFNTSDHKVDTIIHDTRDVGGVVDECISLATQYFAQGDDLYIVYRDVKVIYFYVVNLVSNYEGYTRIWKTDGTNSGTQLFSRIAKAEDMVGVLSNSRLFEMDGRLLWLGDADTLRRFEIFEVKEDSFESLGELRHSENIVWMSYNSMDAMNRNIFYNQIVPVRFGEQDVLKIFQQTTNSEDEHANYLSLIALEENQLKFYADNYRQSTGDTDEEGYIWNVYDVRVWNIGEKLVISRFAEKKKESVYSYVLDFLVGDDYKVMEFDTISMGYENLAGILFSFKVGDELFFNYTDKENGNLIIWSLNAGEVTATKNSITENRLIFSVYPNPASQSITVQSAEHLDGQLSIVGVDGKNYQILRMNGHQKQIDVSQFSNGVYIALYQSGQQVTYERFVIQK